MSTLRALRPLVRIASGTRPCAFHTTARRCDHFLDANAETLQKAVSNKDKVVLVDFYADWCGPCKILSPVLEKLTADTGITSGSGKPLDLVTVNTDDQVDLAQAFQIRSLPTVIAFVDGKPIDKFSGAIPEPAVRNFINRL